MNSKKINEARQLHQQGQIVAALKVYQDILKQTPNNSEILHHCGLALGQIGQLEAGIALIQKAIALDENPLFYNNLGNLYYANSNWMAAIKAYQLSLSQRPDHVHTTYNLAGAHKQIGQFTKGTRVWTDTTFAFLFGQDHADAQFWQGIATNHGE